MTTTIQTSASLHHELHSARATVVPESLAPVEGVLRSATGNRFLQYFLVRVLGRAPRDAPCANIYPPNAEYSSAGSRSPRPTVRLPALNREADSMGEGSRVDDARHRKRQAPLPQQSVTLHKHQPQRFLVRTLHYQRQQSISSSHHTVLYRITRSFGALDCLDCRDPKVIDHEYNRV